MLSLWSKGKENDSMISEAEEEGRRKTDKDVF
jgi:hypothetical protein